MFSKRTQWDLSENPLSLERSDLKARGVRILDLTVSNPTQAGIVYPDGLLAPLAHPDSLVYAPHPKGMLKAREAVGAYYADKGAVVPADHEIGDTH